MKGGQFRFSGTQTNYWERIWNQKKNNFKKTFHSDSNNSEQFILFLIWPFLALINCISNRNSPWAKNIFWLFCIYFGYSFVMSNVNADSYRYAGSFIALSKVNLTFGDFINYLYSEETSYVDILQPLINFILSRFTSDPRILLATFGMIFGYFYSRNLWYLFDKIGRNRSVILCLYILTFALICPIWRINGFRFWTATQIFIFGVLPYLMEGKRTGIWIAATSVFVHFSFMFPIALLLIYVYAGNRRTIYFILFITTSFINELDLDSVKNSLSILPDIFQSKVNIYVKDDILTEQNEAIRAANWYIENYTLFIKWIIYIFLTIIYIKGFFLLKSNKALMQLFCFSLLFYSFCNIAALTPSGIRFYTIGNLLVFFFIIIYLTHVHNQNIIDIMKVGLTPLLLIVIVVSIRMGFEFTGLISVFGNPIFAPFLTGDIPLIDLIKK